MSVSVRSLLLFVCLNELLAATAGAATIAPLSVSGWNRDFVWALSEVTAASGTDFSPNIYVYYEKGAAHNGGVGGLPSGSSFVSNANANTAFQLQPAATPNTVVVTTTATTLTLAVPNQFSTIAFLGATGSPNPTITYSLNFTSGAPTTGTFTLADWTAPNAIVTGLYDRVSNGYAFGGAGMSETDVALSPADQLRLLSSITFSRTTTTGYAWLMAVSAQTVPEPSALAMLLGLGGLGLSGWVWRRCYA